MRIRPETFAEQFVTACKKGVINIQKALGGTQPGLTAEDSSTVDGTYGAEEQAVIENLRTRVGELETALQELGLLG